MINVEIATLSQFKAWVTDFSKDVGDKDLILLEGPLGAGKSQFVQFLVEAMGGGATQSPTFAIHNHYSVGSRSIEHFDLYRLENEEDLESTGFWDFFGEDEGILCVEWSDRLDMSVFPKNWRTHKISIFVNSDLTRLIEYDLVRA